jgi:hypothetical protein
MSIGVLKQFFMVNKAYIRDIFGSWLQLNWLFKGQFLRGIRADFFNHFSMYHMKILLGDFTANMGRENIFIPTIGNESLHQNTNDYDVRIVNLAPQGWDEAVNSPGHCACTLPILEILQI